MEYLQRFGLVHHVFPQNAKAETFFEMPGYERLRRRFEMLGRQPGVGIVVGDVGVGNTSAIRNLCSLMPRPDYHLTYLCATAISPVELYRQLATELGVRPSHRRGEVWRDLKAAMTHMVDDEGVQPVLILDEAQHLSDRFLTDLSGFLNFAMDSRPGPVLIRSLTVADPATARGLPELAITPRPSPCTSAQLPPSLRNRRLKQAWRPGSGSAPGPQPRSERCCIVILSDLWKASAYP
jgi:type II secretory pathway predicted ATPase ExeA